MPPQDIAPTTICSSPAWIGITARSAAPHACARTSTAPTGMVKLLVDITTVRLLFVLMEKPSCVAPLRHSVRGLMQSTVPGRPRLCSRMRRTVKVPVPLVKPPHAPCTPVPAASGNVQTSVLSTKSPLHAPLALPTRHRRRAPVPRQLPLLTVCKPRPTRRRYRSRRRTFRWSCPDSTRYRRAQAPPRGLSMHPPARPTGPRQPRTQRHSDPR